MKYLGIT